jgi:hypothetical protein
MQMQQTDSSTSLPKMNFNLLRKICVTPNQLRPDSSDQTPSYSPEYIAPTHKKIVAYVEKIKVKVYVNQRKSLSQIKIRQVYEFSLCFPHDLLMTF